MCVYRTVQQVLTGYYRLRSAYRRARRTHLSTGSKNSAPTRRSVVNVPISIVEIYDTIITYRKRLDGLARRIVGLHASPDNTPKQLVHYISLHPKGRLTAH